jgi:rhodanese-related sulfurtransferase
MMSVEETLVLVRSVLPRLSPAEAHAAVCEEGTFVVDTRPESQRRASGEIPGAIVIERNHLEWRLDPRSGSRIPEAVNPGVRGIVICEGGYSSSFAAESLRRVGLPRSTDVIGGFQAWHAAGLPVDHPPVPTRPRGPGEGSAAGA